MLSLFLLLLGAKEAPMLDCTITKNGAKLAISYTVTNASAAPILLFNRLYRVAGAGSFTHDPNAVYVLEEQGGVAIAKKLLDHPGRPIERPEVPGVTRLEAGKSFSESISIDLPLVERSPYLDGKPKTLSRGKVRFVLGVIDRIDGLELRPLDDGLIAPRHDEGRGRQKLLICGSYEL